MIKSTAIWHAAPISDQQHPERYFRRAADLVDLKQSPGFLEKLDGWKTEYGLKNWYLRDVSGYIGIHIYFKNSSNFYYPWELQVWDEKDAKANIENHMAYKRNFVR